MVVDVYPATLEGLEPTPLSRVRVRIEEGRLRVWRQSGPTRTKLIDEQVEDATQRNRGRRNPWTVILKDGRAFTFQARGGCGCGDPLKRFDPRSEE